MSDKIGYAGCLLFIGMMVTHASQYGTRWEFGRYCMARALVAEDGQHYLDGAVAPDFVLRFRELGIEEEVQLQIWCFGGLVALTIPIIEFRRWRRHRQIISDMAREHGMSYAEMKSYLLSDSHEERTTD